MLLLLWLWFVCFLSHVSFPLDMNKKNIYIVCIIIRQVRAKRHGRRRKLCVKMFLTNSSEKKNNYFANKYLNPIILYCDIKNSGHRFKVEHFNVWYRYSSGLWLHFAISTINDITINENRSKKIDLHRFI